MKQSQSFNIGGQGKIQYVLDGRVTPAGFAFIFISRVLCIMNQEVCILGKFQVGIPSLSRWMIKSQFIIGKKHKGCVPLHEPVSQSATGMAGGNGVAGYGSDGKFCVQARVKADIGFQVLETDGEKRLFHYPVQHIPGGDAGELSILDLYFDLAELQGPEKGKPQDMIPVGVGEQKGVVFYIPLDQRTAQAPDPGSRINNDGFSGFCRYFNTGCLTAILEVLTA
jgi:hypothetical protein